MNPRKDLLDIESLSLDEIRFLLDTAGPFKDLFTRSVKKVPTLRGKSVLTLFYEPSTRTRSSFEIAAKRLSADVTDFPVSRSSVVKGESILDTVDTLQAMRTDYLIVRHMMPGVPSLIAKHTKASIINAGDGYHAHPTQALLDAFTFEDKIGSAKNKKILIVGDIMHSRVARSTSKIFDKLGAKVAVLGPGSLLPQENCGAFETLKSWDEAFEWKPDLVYLLRVQMERQDDQFFPGLGEYHKNYGLTEDRLKVIKKNGTHVMHPGPVNRGVELTDEVMEYERCHINAQVENGIAVRMAVLYWLKPGIESEPSIEKAV